MFFNLFLLFTIVPLAELYLLIRVGQHIGAFNTILIVVLTGVLGAVVARLEGLRVLFSVQRDLETGKMPTEGLIDGLMILVGAILLITPGLITDVVGLLLVIPFTRAVIKIWLKRYFQHRIDRQQGVITVEGFEEEE